MGTNPTLSQIPIVIKPSKESLSLARKRWLVRATAITALILIPVTGLFRIDVSAGFVVLDRQIWFSDFFIVFGFWLTAACALIMLYSTMGTVFCGWICPQNTVSTWANDLTSRLLGKRAILSWGDETKSVKVSAGKDHWYNWAILAIKLTGISMLFALIPMLYFFPSGAIWSFITFQDDIRLAASLYWIYTVFVLITLVNVAVVRHYVCRYMCIYRMWQFLFKTRDTLHINYDETRSDACLTCNFCVTACPVEIDPRNTLTYDSCTNCGECISACNDLHHKKGLTGLLSYKFGARRGKALTNNTRALASLLQRGSWVLPVMVLAIGMFTWGIVSYQPQGLSVYRSDIMHGDHVQNYRINVANKLYAGTAVYVDVEGLPDGSYQLSDNKVVFDTVGRGDLNLHIENQLPPGLHVITVHAHSDSGWQDSYRVHHLVEKG
ncbi:MAG: polyferredoxin-like protein [Gammaproteobacteria bacterium]|nr:MAG: polyferredoxin-like protein [Gammaproteobacteria bacterium]TND02982.1 MAG: polyferredoxin-like protein [Gammaproteobacteria bacterium]